MTLFQLLFLKSSLRTNSFLLLWLHFEWKLTLNINIKFRFNTTVLPLLIKICRCIDEASWYLTWTCFCSLKVFRQEIFSLDKFWFRGSTQNTFKPLVWHLLHQNIFSINDFMKVYEKLIIFIKSLIFNIFWWKKCQTIGLNVFWVDLWNQNLSKINISCPKIFESDMQNQRKHDRKHEDFIVPS